MRHAIETVCAKVKETEKSMKRISKGGEVKEERTRKGLKKGKGSE